MTTTDQTPTPTAELPRWARIVNDARNTTGPGLIATAQRLAAPGTDAPPVLRELARRVLEDKLYRADRPRARATDPATSQAAAEHHRAPARPGGKVHQILRALDRTDDNANRAGADRLSTLRGRTARQLDEKDQIRGAWRRTSELLQDGLVVVMLDDEGEEVSRPKGRATAGRVLLLTDAGREELARLNAAGR